MCRLHQCPCPQTQTGRRRRRAAFTTGCKAVTTNVVAPRDCVRADVREYSAPRAETMGEGLERGNHRWIAWLMD
eukprot:6590704-Lingulodinium_polyedra.AAC.1